MPLIPAVRGQRQVNLCEFGASLVYRVSARMSRAIQRNPFSKNEQTKSQFLIFLNIVTNNNLVIQRIHSKL